MVDVTEISAVLAAAGVLVGVVYYILEIKHQTTIRKTDLIIKLYSMIQSHEYQDDLWKVMSSQFEDYQDYVKKYGSMLSESPMHKAFFSVLAPYEMVGTLLYRKHIDIGFVYDVFGSRGSKMLYEKLKPIILGTRREFDEPGIFVGFEYLHSELLRKEPQLRKTWGKYLSQSS